MGTNFGVDNTGNITTAGGVTISGAASGITQLDVDNLRLDGNTISTTDANGDLLFAPNGTGKVGIGINGPDGTLHVQTATAGVVAAVSGADDFIVENNADAGISILGPNNAFQSLAFGSPADAVGAKIRWTHDEGTLEIGSERLGGEVSFFSGNFVEAARFDSAGNFGIGTGGPTAKLDVAGDVNTSTDYNIGGTQVLSSATLGSGVVNSSLTNLGTLTNLTMGGSSLLQFVQGGKIKFTGGSGNNFIEGNVSNTGRLGFSTENTERISILLGGQVGIGITNPVAKLAVNGGLHVGGNSDPGDNNLQVDGTVGIGTTPLSTTVLQANSTTKGFMPPRWTGAQETTNTGGFGAGDAGVMWYNTTANSFKGWDGTSIVVLG